MGEGDRLRRGQANHHPTDQAGPAGRRDGVEILVSMTRCFNGLRDHLVDTVDMGARGDLRHYPAIGGMPLELGERHIGQDLARTVGAGAYDRRRRIIAARLNAKHEQVRIFSAFGQVALRMEKEFTHERSATRNSSPIWRSYAKIVAMKVIITRPSPDAEAFAREIAAIGGEPVISPVLAIRARQGAIDLGNAGALAFTSSNGVRAFAAGSTERSLQVFAVGASTAAAARAAGFTKVEAADGDVESLAALITQAKPARPVIHFAGSERAGDLISALRAGGVAARLMVIYDAVEIENLNEAGREALTAKDEFPIVVFFSPRSARLFNRQAARAGLSGSLAGATALCLSDEIAAAASELSWREVAVAAERTADAMLQLVGATIAGRKGRISDPR